MADATHPLPAQGGSYTRDASGALIPAGAEPDEPPAETVKPTIKGGSKTAVKED
ncbi:hypothetical protein [Fuscovulum blasticum]|uniref:hypothetical protein n=1 Tax=Fuscovulum blasticum TaxID=1075 RepID=UPI0013DFCEF4|nr:hypothetical protein [Fuscovulum blasticum]